MLEPTSSNKSSLNHNIKTLPVRISELSNIESDEEDCTEKVQVSEDEYDSNDSEGLLENNKNSAKLLTSIQDASSCLTNDNVKSNEELLFDNAHPKENSNVLISQHVDKTQDSCHESNPNDHSKSGQSFNLFDTKSSNMSSLKSHSNITKHSIPINSNPSNNVSESSKVTHQESISCVNSYKVFNTPSQHTPIGSLVSSSYMPYRNRLTTPQDKSKYQEIRTPSQLLSEWSHQSLQTPLQERKNLPKYSATPSFQHTSVRPQHNNYQRCEIETKDGVRRPSILSQKNLDQVQSKNSFPVGYNTPLRILSNPSDKEKVVNHPVQTSNQLIENKKNLPHARSVEDDFKENNCSSKSAIQNELQPNSLKSSQLSSVLESNVEAKSIQSVLHSREDNNIKTQKKSEGLRNEIEKVSSVQISIPINKVMTTTNSPKLYIKDKEYVCLSVLGRGMSGQVLKAYEIASTELRAIKCVNLSTMDKDTAQGCLNEIEMLGKLQASCIVRMFDYEIKYPMVYVILELGDTDLSKFLKTILNEKKLPLTLILYYWTEMLTAVKHIHDHGVIHSDLKPANFLLVQGRLKLIDFGIASNLNADMTSVVKQCTVGTLNYISPEALLDVNGAGDSSNRHTKYKISFKSDVWSLGCILYSMVYGRTPFHQYRTQWAKMNAITNPVPNITFPCIVSTDGNKEMPPSILIDVMRKCLQHDPKVRPTVDELLKVPYLPNQLHRPKNLLSLPQSIFIKIKKALNEDEWQLLLQSIENERES